VEGQLVTIASENLAGHQVFLMSPDGVKIEIYEDKSIAGPIVNHHIHFWTSSVEDTQAWYVKTFGAKAGKRAKFEAADVPGVNLTFTKAETPVVGTKGARSITSDLRLGTWKHSARSWKPRVQIRRGLSKGSGSRHCSGFFHRPLGDLYRADRRLVTAVAARFDPRPV
jgi:hypothetical protein